MRTRLVLPDRVLPGLEGLNLGFYDGFAMRFATSTTTRNYLYLPLCRIDGYLISVFLYVGE